MLLGKVKVARSQHSLIKNHGSWIFDVIAKTDWDWFWYSNEHFFSFTENEGTRNSKIPSWGKPKIIKTSSMSGWSVWNYVRMLEIWVSVGAFLPEFISFSYLLSTQNKIREFFWFFLGHLSHSGDLLLWVGVRRHASCVVRRPLTSSSQELRANLNQIWYVASVG